MANEYFTPSGYPQTRAQGSSSSMRAQLAAIQAAFDKLPVLAGNAGKIVRVNDGATGLVVSSLLSEAAGVLGIAGPLQTTLGNAGAPSHSFTGDSNTGMFSPGADTLAWTVGGSELMRLTSTGLGIGVTPVSAGLHIKSSQVNLLKAETTTARGGGSVVMALFDPTGSKGYFGYGSANDKLQVFQGLNADLEFYVNAAQQFRITPAGQLLANNIHNNASGAAGTTPMLASGTYTPTFTAVANCGSPTLSVCTWTRVGNVVTVSGVFGLIVTASSTLTQAGISLPVASNLTLAADLIGVSITQDGSNNLAQAICSGDVTNDRATFSMTSPAGSAGVGFNFYFSFSYIVK